MLFLFNSMFLQRYSVDFTSRPEEANIPLSAVEPVDTAFQNGQLWTTATFRTPRLLISANKLASADPDPSPSLGLQTFESPGAASNQAQEPETTPEAKEEQKGDDRTCWLINVFVVRKENRTGAHSLLWSTRVPSSFLFFTSVKPNIGSATSYRFPNFFSNTTMIFL